MRRNLAPMIVVGLVAGSCSSAGDEAGGSAPPTTVAPSTCPTLVACLGEIEAWSDDHPDHLPVMVLIEIETQSVPDAAAEGIERTERTT